MKNVKGDAVDDGDGKYVTYTFHRNYTLRDYGIC